MKVYGTGDLSRSAVQDAFVEGEIPVAVYGLGKMGLPLAAVYADISGNVTGVDIDEAVVDSINNGECHIAGEPGLPELVEQVVATGSLSATTDAEGAASNATVHVIIVPTLVDASKQPDLSTIESVASDIASGLDAGDLVIVESTLPPRTCSDVLEPALAGISNLDHTDFGVAFCPERTSSGRALEDIRGAYPKVVGGTDLKATRICEAIYGVINDTGVIPVSDATTAEAVKVFEGVYRDVNIALANELAKLADEMDIDVLEAIDVANTLPFSDIHTPGAGVGGHCIPYYPYFLINRFQGSTSLLESAREINDSMPDFVVDQLEDGLSQIDQPLDTARVVVLGLTYRAGVSETRHAPSIPIVERLTDGGTATFVVDPMLEDFSSFDPATPIELQEIYEQDPLAIVLVTDHDEFGSIDWSRFDRDLVIVDGRQALDIDETRHDVYRIGRSGWW